MYRKGIYNYRLNLLEVIFIHLFLIFIIFFANFSFFIAQLLFQFLFHIISFSEQYFYPNQSPLVSLNDSYIFPYDTFVSKHAFTN